VKAKSLGFVDRRKKVSPDLQKLDLKGFAQSVALQNVLKKISCFYLIYTLGQIKPMTTYTTGFDCLLKTKLFLVKIIWFHQLG